jgi:phosphatidylinositol phospholipase C delta
VWEEKLRILFECVGDMIIFVFVRFMVRRQEDEDQKEPLAVYCAPFWELRACIVPIVEYPFYVMSQ